MHTGKIGELLGHRYLQNQQFILLATNWRHSHWEVDVIASKNEVLHFIEIKTRRTASYGMPEDKVDAKKISYLQNAAAQYLYQHPQWKRIQFDILSISLHANDTADYFFIADVH
jgi:putative endonuclease